MGKIACEVGDIIEFGSYPQNKHHDAESIDWIVLDKKDNKALLISKYALDCRLYNEDYVYVTWETCTLRKWLNTTFLNNAFNKEEQSLICNTKVSASRNPEYNTNQGNDTIDKIFLLSIDEVNKYFSNDNKRKCYPTYYAVEQGAYESDMSTCYWWLRSSGEDKCSASYVDKRGKVDCYGNDVDYGYFVVRPALWINLES